MAPTDGVLFPEYPPSADAKPVLDPCAFFCDPTRNQLGFCLPPCVPLCPAICPPLPDFLHPSQPPAPPSVHSISDGYHARHHDHLSSLLIAMIALLTSAFLVATCYFIYCTLFSSSASSSSSAPLSQLQHRRRRRRHHPEFDHSLDVLNYHPIWYIATVGLQPSVIESIAVCEYKKGEGLVQGTSCAVCLAEFQDGDALRLLPKCCHAFHIPCIDTWLTSRTSCPVCRAPVLGAVSDLQAGEAQVPETVGGSSSSGEVDGDNADGLEGERAECGEEGEVVRPMRRATSMGSLCVELGGKLNSSSSSTSIGCNSLVERSFSCRGKLFSSSRNG